MADNTIVPVYKGMDGTLYDFHPLDSRLTGYGNPPTDPAYQKNNPGGGRVSLRQVFAEVITDPKTKTSTYKELAQ